MRELVITKTEIAERWANNFEQLLNDEDIEGTFNLSLEAQNNCGYSTPTIQEIKS